MCQLSLLYVSVLLWIGYRGRGWGWGGTLPVWKMIGLPSPCQEEDHICRLWTLINQLANLWIILPSVLGGDVDGSQWGICLCHCWTWTLYLNGIWVHSLASLVCHWPLHLDSKTKISLHKNVMSLRSKTNKHYQLTSDGPFKANGKYHTDQAHGWCLGCNVVFITKFIFAYIYHFYL